MMIYGFIPAPSCLPLIGTDIISIRIAAHSIHLTSVHKTIPFYKRSCLFRHQFHFILCHKSPGVCIRISFLKNFHFSIAIQSSGAIMALASVCTDAIILIEYWRQL